MPTSFTCSLLDANEAADDMHVDEEIICGVAASLFGGASSSRRRQSLYGSTSLFLIHLLYFCSQAGLLL